MKRWIATVFASLSLLAAAAHANPVVYEQPSTGGGAAASQNDPGFNGDFAKVYDNFTLATATSITDVHWVGMYFNPAEQAPLIGFLIQFWSDAGGVGTLLFSETVTGTANETLLSDSTFSYDVDLSSAFLAQAGTTYWVSIQANLIFPPQWGWIAGTGGDNLAYQDFFGSRSRVDADRAFSLTGVDATTTVPEPASMLLVAAALLGVAAASRRRAPR